MLNDNSRRWFLAGFIVLATIGYYVVDHYLDKKVQKNAVTIYQQGAGGLSVFFALRESAVPGSTAIQRSAVLTEAVLKNTKAVLLLAPRAPVTNREAVLLTNWVRGGGLLFTSFHLDSHFMNLRHVFGKLNITSKTLKNGRFANGVVENLAPKTQSRWFLPTETYAFYAPLTLDDAGCASDRFSCFVKRETVGSGEIVIFAGLPPLANTLIGHASNRQLAFRMMKSIPKLTIDEYHHFFSEKTFGDLMMEPSFVLPLGGMILMAMLYFLFARTEFHEKSLLGEEFPAGLSHHEIAERIALGGMESAQGLMGAVRLHAKLLQKRFPQHRDRIDSLVTGHDNVGKTMAFVRAKKLIELHKQLLKEKGRIPSER